MNVERLRALLEAAVKLELATIPPYLCALYSIHPSTNDEATLVIRSVVVEEMLHMILAANVLNAIGGRPRVSGPANAPHYPHELPDGVILDLLPFSPAALESFLQVENPKYKAEAAKAEHVEGRRDTVHASHVLKLADRPDTIGAFYAEIEAGLKEVAAEIGEEALFCGDPARQIGGDYYYAGGGAPIIVTDLDSACRALQEIVEQGEGEMTSAFDADGDLAHYYRFEQLKYGRSYQPGDGVGIPTGPPVEVDFDAAYPMLPNPTTATSSPTRTCAPSSSRPTVSGRCCSSRSTRPSTGRRLRCFRPSTRCSGCATRCSCCSPTRCPATAVTTPVPRSSGSKPATVDTQPIESGGRVVIFPDRRHAAHRAPHSGRDLLRRGRRGRRDQRRDHRRRAEPGGQARPRPRGRARRGPLARGLRGVRGAVLRHRVEGQPVPLPGQPQRSDAPEHATPAGSGRASRTPAATWSRTGPSPPTRPTPACSVAPPCTGRPRPRGCSPRTSTCAAATGWGGTGRSATTS